MQFQDEGWPADAAVPQQDDAGDVTGPLDFGPPSVSTPEAAVLEPHPEGNEEANEPTSKEDDPLPEFDPKVREDFEGLLYLGRLSRTFTWAGHDFTIRTLSIEETLEVGILSQPYRGTLSELKAYQAALVACCVTAVDGRPMPVPITDSPRDTSAANRFQYVLRHWLPPVLDAVYEEYLHLEGRVGKVIQAMGKAPR